MRRLALPALLALACNPGFDPQYRVTDLRILAVHAEVSGSADADGVTRVDPDLDQTLQLEVLVANPRGRPDLADVDVTWLACAPTVDGTLPPCVDPTLLNDPAALRSAGAFEIGKGPKPPAYALPDLPPGARAAFDAAVDAARRLALSQPTYQCRIYVEIPLVVVAEARGRREVALKRVRLVQRPAEATHPYDGYVVNQNPVIDDAYRAPIDEDTCTGGTHLAPPAAFPAGRTTLCGRASASSPPGPFNVCGPAGERTPSNESYGWQWYVTAGEFPAVGGLGNAEGTHLEFERPPGAFTLWLILRDGRGGDVWKRFDVGPATQASAGL